MKNLSSAVRLTSTLSMLPVLLLSKDKSSSGGTPGSKKSWPVINNEHFSIGGDTHPFWAVFSKFKEVLIFPRECLVDVLKSQCDWFRKLSVLALSRRRR